MLLSTHCSYDDGGERVTRRAVCFNTCGLESVFGADVLDVLERDPDGGVGQLLVVEHIPGVRHCILALYHHSTHICVGYLTVLAQ